MSKIDELIAELCPNGVEFKHIWEVAAWDKRFNAVDNKKQTKTHKYSYLLASELRKLAVEGGTVKLLSTGGEVYGYTTEDLAGKNISEGEIISIPWGGRATVQYYNGKFVTADNRIATSLDKKYLDNKYLYYFMLSNLRILQSYYRGSGIQHPSMAKVLDIRLPIPPIEIQKEIVTILDKFTQLEAELEAELEARRKQYEYYRNQLLTFSDEGGVRWTTLGEAAMFRNGKGHEKDVTDDGKYIIVNSKFISTDGKTKKYTDNQMQPLKKNDIVMVMSDLPNGKALGKTFFIDMDEKYSLNQRICSLTFDESKNLPRFFYFLLNRHSRLLAHDNRVDQTNLKRSDIENLRIPIPPLAEQVRISTILDKFDKLVHDISEGLPAELSARRKQYEYYRTKLLTFQEVGI